MSQAILYAEQPSQNWLANVDSDSCKKGGTGCDLQPAAGVLYAQSTHNYYYQYPSQLVFALYNVVMFFIINHFIQYTLYTGYQFE